MKPTATLRLVFLTGLAFVAADTALYAQPGAIPGASRPAFSPYLNLLRQGNPTYLNYYGLVRPQQTAISGLNNLQQQFSGLNQSVNTLANTGPFTGGPTGLSTGHAFGFQTQRSYFLNSGTGQGGGGQVGGGAIGGGGGGGQFNNARQGAGGNVGSTPRQANITPRR